MCERQGWLEVEEETKQGEERKWGRGGKMVRMKEVSKRVRGRERKRKTRRKGV